MRTFTSPQEVHDMLARLKKTADSVDATDISGVLLDNWKFSVWPGSAQEGSHHYGTNGLMQHTYEVADLMLRVRAQFPVNQMPSQREVFLAALFHDCGKIWDYHQTDDGWTFGSHKRMVHHISRSGIEWSRAVDKFPRHRDIEFDVLHAILAHHGQRQFGSPVAPKSRLAWLLHYCDGISARMDDADTLDIIKVNK